MKAKILLFALTILCLLQIDAQTYIIDSGHSSVQIQVERFGVVDVVGRFKDVSGSISYNKDDMSKTSANATIKVESYDANNLGGENAVKSEVFLDVKSYPEISFTGNKIVSNGNNNLLIGELTIHGVTKTIELPFTIKGPAMDLATQKQSIAFNASITINRQDYDISFNRQLPNGTKLVGDDVKITLLILGVAE